MPTFFIYIIQLYKYIDIQMQNEFKSSLEAQPK